ncbi:MAG: hypothetical protein HYY18_13235 [Planctomycetes bacterium]|nr:hypothetical protein [Planctomycetota bacterium]
MSKSCGLEITPTALRAVVVDGNAKSWRVVAFAEADVPVPAEGQDPKIAFTEAVAKFVVEKKLPRGTLIPSLQAGGAVIREVALPFGSDDQLRKTVKFELESHAHNVEVDEVVVDFVKVDQKEKQTFLLAFAVQKKEIRARLDQMALARTDPPSMDLDASAVLNALLAGPAAGVATAFVAFHAGREGSYVYHVSGGLKLLRVIPLSSAEDDFEAKAAAEVSRTLLRVSGGKDLPQVMVSGDADDLPGLASRIGRETGVEAEVVDLFGTDALDIEGAERARRGGGAALGLALKGIGVDRVGLDFRREEFTYERKTDQLKKAAAVLLCLVNVFFGLGAVKAWQDRSFFQSRHGEITQIERKMFADLFPGEKEPERPLEALQSRKAEEQEFKGGGAHPIPKSALEYWADLFGQLKVQNKFFIETLSVSAVPGQSSIKMSGRMDPPEEAEKILQSVKTLKAFSAAKPPAVTQEKSMWRYDIDIPITAEEPK